MKSENGVLMPTENMWLYNQNSQIICNKVILGIEADETDWNEITEEEKVRLETLWNERNLPDSDEATTADLYNALAELGVE